MNLSKGNLKIITVEDSPIVIERVCTLLSDIKHVQFAGNATNITDAQRLIIDQKPDIAILDIHLKENAPHWSGIDLLTSLRADYPNLVIMMLTNLSSPQYQIKCLSKGANYFFDKSDDFDKIADTIKSILSSTNYSTA